MILALSRWGWIANLQDLEFLIIIALYKLFYAYRQSNKHTIHLKFASRATNRSTSEKRSLFEEIINCRGEVNISEVRAELTCGERLQWSQMLTHHFNKNKTYISINFFPSINPPKKRLETTNTSAFLHVLMN